MSVTCLCYTDFPPRDFRNLRDADEFSSRVRFSTNFLQLDNDGLKFGCRRCGQAWAFRLPPSPPFSWRPEGPGEAAPVEPKEIVEVRFKRRR